PRRKIASLVPGGEHVAAAPEAVRVAPGASTPSMTAAPGRPSGGNVFRREGEYWTIAYGGTAIRLRDTKGLGYIACLLAHPGGEGHGAALAPHGAGDRPHEPDLGAAPAPRATAEHHRTAADLRAS